MVDESKIRIVPPAKVHGDSGVTSVSADSIVENDGEVSAFSADQSDKKVDETPAGGLDFAGGA
jgi:hypothetical protein